MILLTSMEGFICLPPMVRTRAKYKSCGIAILVNNRIYETVNIVKNSGENFYWFTCSLCSDVLFCATYIPPEGCTYSNISIFDDLQHDLLELYQNNSLICLLGDFNARTGNVQDFVTYDENFDQFLNGDSPSYELNSISICDFIANGRVGQDKSLGKKTCKGSSVVDYAILYP